jgi:hypothetical protein
MPALPGRAATEFNGCRRLALPIFDAGKLQGKIVGRLDGASRPFEADLPSSASGPIARSCCISTLLLDVKIRQIFIRRKYTTKIISTNNKLVRCQMLKQKPWDIKAMALGDCASEGVGFVYDPRPALHRAQHAPRDYGSA